jgi:16S rRNA processing protein RimM
MPLVTDTASADPSAGLPADAVEVGRIAGAWGVKGWFKVQAFADDPQALFATKRWHLLPAQGPRPASAPGSSPPALLRVTQLREHGEFVVATAQEVPDRDSAEALRGARVFVGRSSFPTPSADEFYWVDLLGCAVVNREGAALGTVAELLDTGAHSVLRVTQGESERLIPFVAAYVGTVDLAAKRIEVDWGLDY